MAKTQEKSISSNHQTEETGTQVDSTTSGKSNSHALEELQGTTEEAPINVGDVHSSGGFINAAGDALNALLPNPGAYSRLSVSGNIPLYATGVLNVLLCPKLMLQAGRQPNNKIYAMIRSDLTLKVEGDAGGESWWNKFNAHLSANVFGMVRIVGDTPREIFEEFMLSLRTIIEGAADSCGMPDKIKEPVINAVMSGEKATSVAENMDEGDSVTYTMGVGVSGGAEVGPVSASGGANYMKSATLHNKDGDGKLELKTKDTVMFTGNFNMDKFQGASAPVRIAFNYEKGELVDWYFMLGANFNMDMEKFSTEIMMGTEWAIEMMNTIANLIAEGGESLKKPSLLGMANFISGVSIADEMIEYSLLGDKVKNMGSKFNLPEMGKTLSGGIMGKVGWSKSKGLFVDCRIMTAKAWSLNAGLMSIEGRSGETLVFLNYAQDGGFTAGS